MLMTICDQQDQIESRYRINKKAKLALEAPHTILVAGSENHTNMQVETELRFFGRVLTKPIRILNRCNTIDNNDV